MKRERPPMPPLSVRVKVAERQADKWSDMWAHYLCVAWQPRSNGDRLKFLLEGLFPDGDYALDHDPALILRKYNPHIKNVAARYTPHAHDPDALIYRRKSNHDQKTFGRKEGAAKTVTTKGSDIWLKSKFNRLEGRTKQRQKSKIPSRPFAKGRPFPKRSAP